MNVRMSVCVRVVCVVRACARATRHRPGRPEGAAFVGVRVFEREALSV